MRYTRLPLSEKRRHSSDNRMRLISQSQPPKADHWDYDESFRPSLEVDDRVVSWSGLYDADGEPLFKVPAP